MIERIKIQKKKKSVEKIKRKEKPNIAIISFFFYILYCHCNLLKFFVKFFYIIKIEFE